MITLHLTWWWLLYGLAGGIYLWGVVAGFVMSMFGCEDWWFRPLVLVWPLALIVLAVTGFVRFMLGFD